MCSISKYSTMLLSAATSNAWWAQRSPSVCISLFRRHSSQLHFSSSLRTLSQISSELTISRETVYVDEDCKDFLPWLERKAGMEVSSVLSIANSPYGRSLCASKPIRAGDLILQVPYSVQMASDNLPPEILHALGDVINDVAKVALLILYEQKLGQDSDWAPYISRLPPPDQMHNTLFWSHNELQMIRPSALYQETLKQKLQIENQFGAIKSALTLFPEVFHDVTLKDFKYAYTLVTSRAWESSRGVSLIPFADFLNHNGKSDSFVMSDERHKISEVIADCDYAPGDQVLISYGKFSNSSLLLDFGFTLDCNIYDQVPVELYVLPDDHLSAVKLDLLYRHPTPTTKDVNGFKSSENSFSIKEVKSPHGKGRGIPQSLRAFARVVSSNSAQELSDLAAEAAENDGRLARHPLKNKSRETEAHQFLLSTINSLIESYDACIETLQRPAFNCLFEKCEPKRRTLAMSLLVGERRVLKSASTWLENYCTNLLAHKNENSF